MRSIVEVIEIYPGQEQTEFTVSGFGMSFFFKATNSRCQSVKIGDQVSVDFDLSEIPREPTFGTLPESARGCKVWHKSSEEPITVL